MRANIAAAAVLAWMLVAPSGAASTRSEWTATPSLWDSGSYTYDAAGNIVSIGADIYRYDHVGRLKLATAATTIPNQQTYTYDRYGNLTSVTTTSGQTTEVHDFAVSKSTNQLSLDCSGTNGCFTGLYDAATGNQLGRLGSGEYQWDAFGMMTALNTNRHERYIYDANNERILIVDQVTGSERYTLRDTSNKVTRELTRNGSTWTLRKDYVYRGATLMASFSGALSAPDRHYHSDHLGSTRVVTDAGGYRLAMHTYLPFGAEAKGSESDDERMKFTGHERDSSPGTSPGSDLDYMHARYYDANASRFLSVDPKRSSARPAMPLTWNRYLYVLNNPLKYIDENGEDLTLVVRAPGEGITNFGHVAVRVHGNGYDRTYDFGRYRGTWGFIKSKGEGILRVWSNHKAFMAGQQKKGDVQTVTWQTSAKSDQAVMDFFNEKIASGEKIATTANYTSYKLDENYSLLSNNCTTISMDGISAGAAHGDLEGFNKVRDEMDPGDVSDEVAKITKEEEEEKKKNQP